MAFIRLHCARSEAPPRISIPWQNASKVLALDGHGMAAPLPKAPQFVRLTLP
jgi:hypothetical protein